MSIRTVNLVNCDRGCGTEFIPLHCHTPAGAREDAADDGWTHPKVSAPTEPVRFEDWCPACSQATKPI